MDRSSLGKAMALLACAGLLLPQQVALAADPNVKQAAPAAANAGDLANRPAAPAIGDAVIEDIALGAGQSLRGTVVGENGTPSVGTKVVVRQGENVIANVMTNDSGEFAVTGLRGGVHQVDAGRGTGVYRLWQAQTAPPHAKQSATMVDKVTVRGQRPFRDFFNDGTIILGLIIAAAIAVPIAVHNSDDNGGSGS